VVAIPGVVGGTVPVGVVPVTPGVVLNVYPAHHNIHSHSMHVSDKTP